MKQLNKIILSLVVFMACLFVNTNKTLAEELLDCSNTLKSGAKGEQVKLLQTELNTVMSCNLTIDGSFGAATKTCVVSFQGTYALSQDASVGPLTCNKLNEEYLELTNVPEDTTEDSTEENTEDNTDLICSSSNNLKKGSQGEQVKYLQEKLNKTMGCSIKADGKFGPATQTCVKNFQAEAKLTQDGVVGTTTCKTLKNIYNNRTNEEFNKQGNEETLNCRNPLKKGAKGTNVKLLQTELNKAASCNLTVDGSFGGGTLSCVKKFQESQGLDVDGSVGASTCGKLNTEYLKDNTYVISKDITSIKKSASDSSTEIAVATYGTVFKVYSTLNNWYKIKYNNEYAYVKTSDIQKSSVIVDLSSQTLKLYKDGKLTLEAPVITGTKGKSETPTGKYLLENANIKQTWVDTDYQIKLSGTNLKGEYYERKVTYWMKFIVERGIGFHEAWWRSSSQFYDINTYLTSGSLGCVNMRPEDAAALYKNIKGADIYVHVVE